MLLQYSGTDTSTLSEEISQRMKAKSGLLSAEVALKEAEMDLKYSVIKAPFSGIVADVLFAQYELVASGDALCQIYDKTNLQCKIQVLEVNISELQIE